MRACQSGSTIARSLLLFAAVPLFALTTSVHTQTPTDPSSLPTSSTLPPAPAPKPPVGPPNLAKMSPKQIADLAAYNIALANLAVAHYTYKETEHNQNIIDGKLVVDHTTVTENIFINNLPYMRKIMVDGQPLEGKELKAEQKLYDQAVKDRRALDPAARAAIEKHALRSTSPNIDRLSTYFVLKMDGHQTISGQDCVILDAMPRPDNTNPDLAQHIRIALEADSGDVLDVNVEFLADDNGFSKGSVLHTRYKIVGANALPDFQNWDTVVRFKELLDKAITIHRERTFTDYKRFRATVTIKSFAVTDKDSSPDAPDSGTPIVLPASSDAAAPAADNPVNLDSEKKPAAKLTSEEKAKLKADEKAKAEADAKAKADAKAQAQAEAKAKSEADAKAKADAKAQAAEQAKAKAEADAQAKAEAKAKADADALAQEKIRADAKAKADAEAKAKADERAQAKLLADAKAKAEADERARVKAQQAALAKQDADEKARLKTDLARAEAEAKAQIKAQSDDIKRQEAETRAKLKEQSKEQARLDAATKANADAKAKAAAQPATSDATSSAPDGSQPK